MKKSQTMTRKVAAVQIAQGSLMLIPYVLSAVHPYVSYRSRHHSAGFANAATGIDVFPYVTAAIDVFPYVTASIAHAAAGAEPRGRASAAAAAAVRDVWRRRGAGAGT